jgi:hypothetical protein
MKKLTEITASMEATRDRPTQRLHASVAIDNGSGQAGSCGCEIAQDHINEV